MSDTILHKVELLIEKEKLFPPKTPLLIACSGGPDSMAAVYILQELGYPIGIAHCNFKLRQEADEEQQFVSDFAKSNNIPFFSIDFDTQAYAEKSKLSIQEAARDLRYNWLEDIRKNNGFHFIVTAHHKNDSVETILMQITKGSGLNGLTGIPPKNGKIVRPLLNLEKSEIVDWLAKQSIAYKLDASNESNKYTRNYIRNEVIPKLESVNPKVIHQIYALGHKAQEAKLLMNERLLQIKRKIVSEKYGSTEIKFGYILAHPAGSTILFEILKEFGFNSEQSKAIFENLNASSGIEFLSSSHRLIKDRKSLFVSAIGNEKECAILQWQKLPNQIVFNNYKIQVDELPLSKVSLKKSENYAFFDAAKIEFPLTLRYWKPGDYFYPFGLTKAKSNKIGKKKLSKYFKDAKVSIQEKENVPVLFSGDKLIWLVGHRMDDRFKVTNETNRVVKMKIVKS